MGRGRLNVTDLLGLLALSDVVAATDGESVDDTPAVDGPASSPLEALTGVPSDSDGLG